MMVIFHDLPKIIVDIENISLADFGSAASHRTLLGYQFIGQEVNLFSHLEQRTQNVGFQVEIEL